jgi:hypothetical protein
LFTAQAWAAAFFFGNGNFSVHPYATAFLSSTEKPPFLNPLEFAGAYGWAVNEKHRAADKMLTVAHKAGVYCNHTRIARVPRINHYISSRVKTEFAKVLVFAAELVDLNAVTP